ncbi:hypothetical protein Tsubulata_040814 [Turnera subulata]|uniref:NB-ARC domain-containing protein n=1 Tax=Turnera subulata TaxID=218843 RepID=A0A9Q0J1I6_9ROSI|nr:hypothetical protein Tsubulata_040814 [Turnera subulata]
MWGVEIRDCNEIRCFQLGRFLNLSRLAVMTCLHFESLCGYEETGPLTSLPYLKICGWSSFTSFQQRGTLYAPNLRVLYIYDANVLESLPRDMHCLLPSLIELTLFSCTKLKSFPEGGLPSSIEKLVIVLCNGIESSPKGGFPPNLKELHILGCHKPVILRKLNKSKKRYAFLSLRNLKSLDYKELQHL